MIEIAQEVPAVLRFDRHGGPGLTKERLRAVLSYDPDTGALTWQKRTSNRVKAGSEAGASAETYPGKRYVTVKVDGKRYYAHRLAWLYMTGSWPAHTVDHINGNSSDNRWANLRDVPHRINGQNRRAAQSNSKSGLIGAYPNGGRWISQIQNEGRAVWLGSFATAHDAHCAYVAAKRKMHEGCTL
jgi:hypothetical protein